jgi:hypothetical protein
MEPGVIVIVSVRIENNLYDIGKAFGERAQQGCRTYKTVLKPKTLGSLMSGFQSSVTRRVNQIRKTPGISVWQRNYLDRIIRDKRDCYRIRDYIQNNPLNWHQDKENPLN